MKKLTPKEISDTEIQIKKWKARVKQGEALLYVWPQFSAVIESRTKKIEAAQAMLRAS